MHAQHPEWRIAVTFNTRALKGYFRRLINNFSLEQTGEEPNWRNLRVLNAWGAPGTDDRDGLYFEFCRTHGVDYFDFSSARRGDDEGIPPGNEMAFLHQPSAIQQGAIDGDGPPLRKLQNDLAGFRTSEANSSLAGEGGVNFLENLKAQTTRAIEEE